MTVSTSNSNRNADIFIYLVQSSIQRRYSVRPSLIGTAIISGSSCGCKDWILFLTAGKHRLVVLINSKNSSASTNLLLHLKYEVNPGMILTQAATLFATRSCDIRLAVIDPGQVVKTSKCSTFLDKISSTNFSK